MLIRSRSRGDTVIEVLFAITVFSLIAIGGMTLMNRGAALAQQALEIGLVRQQIDSQADALRFLSAAYSNDYGNDGEATDLWKEVVENNNAEGGAERFDEIVSQSTGECNIPSAANGAFALNIKRLDTDPILIPTNDTATYAKIRYDGPSPVAEGIWIQAVRSRTDNDRPGFYDFHIRACWYTPGQARPVTLGTIVRLYEPRG